MDYDQLLKIAKLKVSELTPKSEFILRDLFQGTFWNDLDIGVRLEFGRRFKYAVTHGNISQVNYLGKKDNNASLYAKQ